MLRGSCRLVGHPLVASYVLVVESEVLSALPLSRIVTHESRSTRAQFGYRPFGC
jgi:hypothetical protein